MNARWTLDFMIFLVLSFCGLFIPTTAFSGPIFSATEADTDLVFIGTILGGEITVNQSHPFAGTTSNGFWSYSFTIQEFEGTTFAPNDELSINGRITHLKPPVTPNPAAHANDGVGKPLIFDFGVNADNATGAPKKVSNSQMLSAPHSMLSGHMDDFTGTMTADVQTTALVVDNILDWKIVLDVRHCDACPLLPPDTPSNDLTPIPEPSTFFLLGIGLVGILGYGWRRRKQVA